LYVMHTWTPYSTYFVYEKSSFEAEKFGRQITCVDNYPRYFQDILIDP